MTTAEIENRMNEVTGSSPEPCRLCGMDVWADQELGTYVDARALVDTTSACSYFYCGDSEVEHEVAP